MSFLDKVINQKKREIADKQAATPLDKVKERAAAEPGPRDFRGALLGGERIIAEIKKRSPRVDAFPQADNADQLARVYEDNGAAALSVVTDAENFGTSLADAQRYRATVNLPLIAKDFNIDPYQIIEARSYGADAALLISRILGPELLASLLNLVHSLGMAALVECHSRDDVEKALDAGARIVGINNRDLDTLTLSLDTTRQLVPDIPDNVVIVSESGIYNRDEIEELSSLGVHAFLIGGSLLESDDPGALLRELTGQVAGERDIS